MAQVDSQELQRRIALLKASFKENLGKRLDELDSALADIDAAAPLAGQPGVKTLLEHAHKIAGSAGTFGYMEMSNIASETERLCDDILKGRHGSDAGAFGELKAKVAAIHAEAAR
jgi:HPt (histidine-containing phosphotransfer) domain-containing protein